MSNPEAQPLPSELFEKIKSKGIKSFIIYFSFESDEGAIEVITKPHYDEIALEISDWVYKAFSYDQTIGGYGNGERYCDTLEYDLKSMTVTSAGWWMERNEREEEEEFLEIAKDSVDEE